MLTLGTGLTLTLGGVMKEVLLNVLLIFVMMFVVCGSVFAGDVYVNGYTKSNGTYVAPHYRTSPNSTRNDNYSTYGNTNPYTGEAGTKARDGYGSSSGGSSSSSYRGNGLVVPGQRSSYGY